MNDKIHGLMNIYYENYGSENQGPLYQPYCVNCGSYDKSVEFIRQLEDLGFAVVEGQSHGYFAVLVNLELMRCAGIRLACRYITPDKEIDLEDFEQILKEHLKEKQL